MSEVKRNVEVVTVYVMILLQHSLRGTKKPWKYSAKKVGCWMGFRLYARYLPNVSLTPTHTVIY